MPLTPHRGVGHRVPRDDLAKGFPAGMSLAPVVPIVGIPQFCCCAAALRGELLELGVGRRRDEEQLLLRIEGHGFEAMGPQRVRQHHGPVRLFPPTRRGIVDRPARALVQALGPVDAHVVAPGDECARLGVEDVDEAILPDAEDDPSLGAAGADGQRRDHDAGRLVVPAIPGRLLEVPAVRPGLRVEGHDGAGEEFVARALAALARVDRNRAAGPDVELREPGIVGDALPGVARAGRLAPTPGGGRHLVELALLRLLGIARHRVEAPEMTPGPGVESIDVAAVHTHLGAGVADEHHPVAHSRRSRDRVQFRRITGLRFPALLATCLFDGHEGAVGGGDDHQVVVEGHAPVQPLEGGLQGAPGRGVGARRVRPQELPCAQIVREDLAAGTTLEDPTVLDERIAHQAVRGREVDGPDESERTHRLGVDFFELRVVLHLVGVAEQRPVGVLRIVRVRRMARRQQQREGRGRVSHFLLPTCHPHGLHSFDAGVVGEGLSPPDSHA